MRDWVATVETTHYCLGSVMGPHPYPWMVREFQRVIGDEARAQCEALLGGPIPTSSWRASAVARTRPASSRASPTRDARAGRRRAGRAARRSATGVPGVVHGMKSYLMQDEYGQVLEAQSISAGLDYPGVGPEHAHLADHRTGRYVPVTDAEVIEAFQLLSRTEGIIPALEPAHALAWVAARPAHELRGQDGARQPVGPGRQGRRADDGPRSGD